MKRMFAAAGRLALSLAAAMLVAQGAFAAIWQGGASGNIDDAANWDGDIATSSMVFTNDVTLSLANDATVYNVLTNYSNNTIPVAARGGRTIVFDMNGKTLRSYGKPRSGNTTMWHLGNSTYRFTNGTFLNVAESGSVTNSFLFENASMGIGKIEATGSGTTFVSGFSNRARSTTAPDGSFKIADGAEAFGTYAIYGTGSTNEISGGASLYYDGDFYLGVNNGYGPNRDNLLTVDGATLSARNPASAGILRVGSDNSGANNSTPGVEGNLLLAKNGAKIDAYCLYVGYASGANAGATNNEMRLTGAGTKFTHVATANATSLIGTGAGSVSNRLVVADHAVAEFNRVLCIGLGSSLGGTLRIENGGVVTNNGAVYIGHNTNLGKNGKSARVVVTGEGSEWALTDTWVHLINGTGDAENAHEIFIGDGAVVTGGLKDNAIKYSRISMSGVGNRLVVSNATATLSNLFTTNAVEGISDNSGSTIRIAGANAKLTTSNVNNSKAFAGSEILEFTIPEDGWASAPFQANTAFTIPAGTTLTLDAASVKAYVKAHPDGGTVPLLTTDSTSRSITIENETALAANLPDGCELVNASGVLSVKMPKAAGLTIIVR